MNDVYIITEEAYIDYEGPYNSIVTCADTYETARKLLAEEIEPYLKDGMALVERESEGIDLVGFPEYEITLRDNNGESNSHNYRIEHYGVEHG